MRQVQYLRTGLAQTPRLDHDIVDEQVDIRDAFAITRSVQTDIQALAGISHKFN